MNDTEIVSVLRLMSATGLRVAGPILLVVLVVGVVVSLVQTITQIQEQAVVYVLKFCAVGLLLLFAGPWMIDELSSFIRALWARIPDMQ
ncbi:MAG: flagellar biosynthetic protein FliQ [Actinobacteria bacterium]|nr:flagellar biosynthetic protein FliQ [Actinomycetota bacterium]